MIKSHKKTIKKSTNNKLRYSKSVNKNTINNKLVDIKKYTDDRKESNPKKYIKNTNNNINRKYFPLNSYFNKKSSKLIPGNLQSIKHYNNPNIKVYNANDLGINTNNFDINAINIVKILQSYGYESYIVGGSIRDLLLKLPAKDFDIATIATPNQINKVFRSNCHIIGKRFKLAHIKSKQGIIYECSTFRGDIANTNIESKLNISNKDNTGMLTRDNVFSDLRDDVARRDITINALYYDPTSNEIIDFFDGVNHLINREIIVIGDPKSRFIEDPVRMIRIIRHKSKLDLEINNDLRLIIKQNAHLLTNVSKSRLFDEFNKMISSGYLQNILYELQNLDLIQYVIGERISTNTNLIKNIYKEVSIRTDERIKSNNKVNPALVFSSIIWYDYEDLRNELINSTDSLNPNEINRLAYDEAINNIQNHLNMMNRFKINIFNILDLQSLIEDRPSHRINKDLFNNPIFRAAIYLFEIRTSIEQTPYLTKISNWWHEYKMSNESQANDMIKLLPKKKKRKINKKKCE